MINFARMEMNAVRNNAKACEMSNCSYIKKYNE